MTIKQLHAEIDKVIETWLLGGISDQEAADKIHELGDELICDYQEDTK